MVHLRVDLYGWHLHKNGLRGMRIKSVDFLDESWPRAPSDFIGKSLHFHIIYSDPSYPEIHSKKRDSKCRCAWQMDEWVDSREKETGREAERRWKTWFLCELATIVLHGRPTESAARPLSHFQPRITSAWVFISKISTFKDSEIGRFISWDYCIIFG